MGRFLAVASVALVADVAYWIWQMGNVNAEAGLPRWHADLNLVTFYGGWVLFLVLIVVTVALRRGRGRS